MQLFFILVCSLISVTWSNLIDIGKNYHEAVGIPLVYQIKTAEKRAIKIRRAVKGEAVSITSYPYLAGLIIYLEDKSRSVCSGILLNHQVLVSAAHCWYDGKIQAQKYTVVLGSTMLFRGGLRIKTSAVVVHPKWNAREYINDISIIHLPYKILFSENIRPIALPSIQDSNKTFTNYLAKAAGYGWTKDGISSWNRTVNHVRLRVISNQICSIYYNHVPWTNICTFGRSAICRGDSGGPLIIKKNGHDILIGIASFTHTKGCQWRRPSGFTRVTAFVDYIRSYMDEFNDTI